MSCSSTKAIASLKAPKPLDSSKTKTGFPLCRLLFSSLSAIVTVAFSVESVTLKPLKVNCISVSSFIELSSMSNRTTWDFLFSIICWIFISVFSLERYNCFVFSCHLARRLISTNHIRGQYRRSAISSYHSGGLSKTC